MKIVVAFVLPHNYIFEGNGREIFEIPGQKYGSEIGNRPCFVFFPAEAVCFHSLNDMVNAGRDRFVDQFVEFGEVQQCHDFFGCNPGCGGSVLESQSLCGCKHCMDLRSGHLVSLAG